MLHISFMIIMINLIYLIIIIVIHDKYLQQQGYGIALIYVEINSLTVCCIRSTYALQFLCLAVMAALYLPLVTN